MLSGDYLAELTMSILYNQTQTRGDNMGYVATFLKQVRDIAQDCKLRGIKIVSNADSFLHEFLTVEKFKELLSDVSEYEIERFELPNLRALNFYIHGILGESVSSNHRIDKQAKSFGEYLRAKFIEVPKVLADQI